MRRALASAALATLLACNAIIGLGDPTVADVGDGGGSAGGGSDGSPGADVSSGGPDASTGEDAGSVTFGGSSSGSSSGVTPPGGPDAGTPLGVDSGRPHEMPIVYLVHAAALPGIAVCVGTGADPGGADTVVSSALPYPQHQFSGGPPPCLPLTCAQQHLVCGMASDGCGGVLGCGMCGAPETCGGGGVPGQCGVPADGGACVPHTCQELGVACGPVDDGCGNVMQCDPCPPPTECVGVPGQCAVPDPGGLMPGTGQPGPALPISDAIVTPFLIPTRNLTPGITCDVLLGSTGAGATLPPSEFYRLKPFPAGTFAFDTSTLVVLTGCPAGVGSPATCGRSFDPDAGNLAALAATTQILNIMIPPAMVGFRVVHAAPALDCTATGCVGGPNATLRITWPRQPAQDFPLEPLTPTPEPALLSSFDQQGATATILDPALGPLPTIPFDAIASASNGGSPTVAGAPYFRDGQGYFLVILGDPEVSPDASAARALHILGAPFLFSPDILP
jgi:hypothetical protein